MPGNYLHIGSTGQSFITIFLFYLYITSQARIVDESVKKTFGDLSSYSPPAMSALTLSYQPSDKSQHNRPPDRSGHDDRGHRDLTKSLCTVKILEATPGCIGWVAKMCFALLTSTPGRDGISCRGGLADAPTPHTLPAPCFSLLIDHGDKLMLCSIGSGYWVYVGCSLLFFWSAMCISSN